MSFSIITLDIGGSNINVGRVSQGTVLQQFTQAFNAQATESEIMTFICACIDRVMTTEVGAIAIGVPCIVVDGNVLDAVNVAAWQNVNLKAKLNNHYQIPVYLNNDVNCFIVGEYLNRQNDDVKDMVGICLGTGVGAGFILDGDLYHGQNCSAGEVGSIRYLDANYDEYCSGAYFRRFYQQSGLQLSEKARQGDPKAKQAFTHFGEHLGNLIANLLLMVDPQVIVFGGSVSQSYDLFIDAVWQSLESFPSKTVVDNLQIQQSHDCHSALLGAAHLYSQQAIA